MKDLATVASGDGSQVQTARLFIVDDDEEVRRSISILARTVDLESDAFASAEEFLEQYDTNQPGCLVLDVRMPNMTGFQLQEELDRHNVRLPVIFISAHGEIASATAAMRSGAIDFIPKPFSPQLLLDRIGEAIKLDERQRIIAGNQRDLARLINSLTDREKQVMELLAVGFSSKLIAKRLGISSKTVDNHRAKILDKMGAENTAQLARRFASMDLDLAE